jgi:DNA-binding CsgD family transcriptional regulator
MKKAKPIPPCRVCGAQIERRVKSGRNPWYCDTCRPIKYRAQVSASHKSARAIRSGILPSPKTLLCVDCGAQAQHYDHRDYLKPLDVVPTCISCNLKRGSAEDIADAVVARKALEALPKPPPRIYVKKTPVLPHGLTVREQEVLNLSVAQPASSYKQIASGLGISHRTLEVHLLRAYRKIGVTRRHEAIAVNAV